MKTRQYRQLMSLGVDRRMEMVSEGLDQIATYLVDLANELDKCSDASMNMVRASVLLRNVAREEAGKFLILVDSCRADRRDQKALTTHLSRAGDHLAKLIYAQIADYSIGSQSELLRAVEMHRQQYHLDGPNDVDYILPNWLITERESALYVDLIDYDANLAWTGPFQRDWPENVPKSVNLVLGLHHIGATTPTGLRLMNQVWRDFDPTADSHYSQWVALNATFIKRLGVSQDDSEIAAATQLVIHEWPMPMVHIDIELNAVDLETLRAERTARLQAEFASDYVDPYRISAT